MDFGRILVRATNWVGDAVMSIPALQALRTRFPHAHIAILAKPWVAQLYGREPFCDELIPYEAPTEWRGVSRKWGIASNLRSGRFDAAILFPNAFEAAAVARVAGIPRRIGYNRDGRGWLLTDSIPVPEKGEIPVHQRFYYLELLKRAKLIEGYSPHTSIRLSGARTAAEKGREHFRNMQIGSAAVIGVSPGAAYGGAKRWLPERFGAAAVRLARERDAAIAIFGSKEEREVCALVQQAVEAGGARCMNFAGETTLGTFIEMAAACELYLTNDSGPMHIASALGVPTVVVFGATDEQATGPTGDLYRIVREPVECSPCLLRECPIDHRCMTRVTSDRVAETALNLVETVRK
jgi:heptosyltransferase II